MSKNGGSPRGTSFSDTVSSQILVMNPVINSDHSVIESALTGDGFGEHFSETTRIDHSAIPYQVQPSENRVSESAMESTDENLATQADVPPHCLSSCDLSIHEESGKKVIVTRAFPQTYLESGVLVETIRDPRHPKRMVFLKWENGNATFVNSIKHGGHVFVPPDPSSKFFPL
jgi:hypothetical protein